ncbi:MAG: FAD-dependent oxidoreductase [Desulfurococcales archaeon]|nr:FAD-dependent oxidoreductase [Desulfurococcales archaeon]
MGDVGRKVPERFDVIVVGAGPAGCAASYMLAKSGFKVLLLERGRGPGSKELYGGRIYAQPLRDVWPDLDKKAPIHRWVTKERFSFTWGSRVVTLEYRVGRSVSFTTYLPEMAKWMADRATEAGALLVDEVVVDDIVVRDGRVVGVRSGTDFLRADVVIDAEGVNRILLEKLGLAERLDPGKVAIGAKEVLRVGEGAINDRLGLSKKEGLAWLVAGDVTEGVPGGGFIYTMKDTISVGIVLHVGRAVEAAEKGFLRTSIHGMVEKLRLHNYFKQIWGDADVVEYGGHLTIEGGLGLVPKKLYMDGFLVVGDAAGLLLNTGYTIRGVDFAVTSGKLAAETVVEAFNVGGPTEENLSVYESKLKSSFVWRELVKHRGISEIMSDPYYFTVLPALLTSLLKKLFEADYEEPTIMDAVFEAASEEDISIAKLLLKLASVVGRV